MRRCALAAALALALAFPAASSALTGVRVVGKEIVVTSDPGQQSKLAFGFDLDFGRWDVSDGAGVVATLPCINDGPETATCPAGGIDSVSIATGDARDLVFLNPLIGVLDPDLGLSVALGPGDDTAIGPGQGSYRIFGGPGRDRIASGFGDDLASGGPGDDVIDPGGGRDTLLGGPGFDRLKARDFTRDLRIDCGAGPDRLSRDRFDPAPRSC